MFGSDNQAPAHPRVLEAVVDANSGRAGAYGDDVWSQRALKSVQQIFQTDDLDLYMVGTGGAANGLALSMLCPPWGAVLAHSFAHVVADEGSGPEFFTNGARMIGLGANHAHLDYAHLEEAALRFSPANVQSPQPRAVTLTNLTENGLTYAPADIAAISAFCKTKSWGLHVDGARFANAVAATGASPAELTWQSGVDILSFGLTKAGAMGAEAVIVFGTARSTTAPYLRKRAGHLFSKQRYLSAQFVAMLEDGLWLKLAAYANAMAQALGAIFEQAGAALAFPVQGNEVFVCLSASQAQSITQAGLGFYPWAPAGQGVYRFVACWATCDEDLARVRNALASGA